MITAKEYIEHKKLLSKIRYIGKTYGVSKSVVEKLEKAMADSAAIDVMEVRHSEWTPIPVNGVLEFRCGNIDCARHIPFGCEPSDMHYCPYCGSKMDGDWKLYTEYRGGKPFAYRYGEPWVAMQLAMEGGYKTPEKAKQAWFEYLERERERDE